MIKVEVDLVEIIAAGMDALYHDQKEKFLSIHKLAEELESTDKLMAGLIRHRLTLPIYWEHECIAAGVCPGGPYLLQDPPDDGRVRPAGTRHCPDCGDVTPSPLPEWYTRERVGA